jgi:hypothetical protein
MGPSSRKCDRAPNNGASRRYVWKT